VPGAKGIGCGASRARRATEIGVFLRGAAD
jgi:hypothetical protein